MSKLCRSFLLSFLPITMLMLAGCGAGTNPEEVKFISELVPISGVISLNGEPLTNAMVQFIPSRNSEQARAALGITDHKGAYSLQTTVPSINADKTKGALKGDYKVIISKILLPDGSAVPENISDADAMAEGARESVPQRYSDYENSKLTASITGENKELNFDLK